MGACGCGGRKKSRRRRLPTPSQRPRKETEFTGSQSAGDRRNQMRGKRKRFERENVKAPGENVFLDASPPRIFWQNWQPDRKVSARTGILGLRWVKKCVGDPTQHQFCTENLGISQQNGPRTYWNSRISHEKNKPGNLPSCYSPSEARPTKTSHVSISRFPLRRLREFWRLENTARRMSNHPEMDATCVAFFVVTTFDLSHFPRLLPAFPVP